MLRNFEAVRLWEELAAANAAFDVIKQTIANGREIYEAGEALARYFGIKSEIQQRAHQHGYKSDIQAFMAAEELAAKEEELKQMMIYQGRGGMWDDWLAFQLEMKRSREQEAREIAAAKIRRRAMILNSLMWIGISVGILILAVSAAMITIAIVK